MLATASLGALFSSCPPEFGARAVLDRWTQLSPSVLVTVDGCLHRGTVISRSDQVGAIRAGLPTLRHVIGVPYPFSRPTGTVSWHELLAEPAALTHTPVPFAHPLWVLFSSGTTGPPKALVHSHGGILLEHMKMLALHHDLGPGDRFFWLTGTGWMMWNYLVSGPAVGAAIVLFDGDPMYPRLSSLWQLAERTRTTYLGVSATYLMAARKAGVEPRRVANLAALRGVGSTGSPLPAAGYHWVHEAVSSTAPLTSLSGGTDLCTGFLGGTPLLPVRPGEITCRCLGAMVEAYDAQGSPIIGQPGELVITRPMPSMPVGLWGDTDATRYRASYFSTYPEVWRHGDWVTVTEQGSCVVSGRSDATLNRGGMRIGTADLYAVVDEFAEVEDSLAVHLEDIHGGPGVLLLFVALAGSAELNPGLRSRIIRALREQLTEHHVPDEIHSVPAVPRTASGKRLEVPVKRILASTSLHRTTTTDTQAHPQILDLFAALTHRIERPGSCPPLSSPAEPKASDSPSRKPS